MTPLLGIDHQGRTRMRASINPSAYARFEVGTAPVAAHLTGLRRMALVDYPVGLTTAPIIAAGKWQEAYGALIEDAAAALAGVADLDLFIEPITHRYTAAPKAVLETWHPGSSLDMGAANRTFKRRKFGTDKQVYNALTMRKLRLLFEVQIASALQAARILHWTSRALECHSSE